MSDNQDYFVKGLAPIPQYNRFPLPGKRSRLMGVFRFWGEPLVEAGGARPLPLVSITPKERATGGLGPPRPAEAVVETSKL